MPTRLNAVAMYRASTLSQHAAARAGFYGVRNQVAHCGARWDSDEIIEKPKDLTIHQHRTSKCNVSVADKANDRRQTLES